MKIKILAVILSALLSVGMLTVFAEEQQPVTAIDGNVTIYTTVEAAEGTPVLIVILPAIIENDVDVTVEKVSALTTSEVLETLKVEYAAVENVAANGVVAHSCQMKDSLTTGLCHVVFCYLGSDGCYSAGTFEHVGRNDLDALIREFNESDATGYGAIIDKDINGIVDTDGITVIEPAKEILRKSSADVLYYSGLADKTVFHNLVYTLKGNEDFTTVTLIDTFNEAAAWHRLRLEEDTLTVLNTYNGEGNGKYWNLTIGADSDFDGLPETEKSKLLGDIKNAEISDKTTLEEMFSDRLALAMFRSVLTREEIADLISENCVYADMFNGVREIIDEAQLNEYNTAILYNAVLEGAKNCNGIEEIEELFEDSIPEDKKHSSGASGSSSSSSRPMVSTGGYSSSGSSSGSFTTSDIAESALPFADIALNHWAQPYIKELYEKGAINGISDTEFAPDNSVQRQDFVKIMIGVLDIMTSGNPSIFNDCSDNAYYTPYVMAAYKNGLVSGIGEGLFGAGQNIRREDAAVIIERVLTMYNLQIDEKVVNFGDESDIADYAREAVERVAAAGVFAGDTQGNFNPKANLSRAEASAILCRLADMIKEV